MLDGVDALRPATGQELVSKLSVLLQIPADTMLVWFTGSPSNITVAFLGPNAYGDLSRALALDSSQMDYLQASAVAVAPGSPPAPAPKAPSNDFIILAAVAGGIVFVIIVVRVVFLLRKSDDDDDKPTAYAMLPPEKRPEVEEDPREARRKRKQARREAREREAAAEEGGTPMLEVPKL